MRRRREEKGKDVKLSQNLKGGNGRCTGVEDRPFLVQGCAGRGSVCPAPLVAHGARHTAGFQFVPALSSRALDLVSYHSSGLRLGFCSSCDLTSELVTERQGQI